MESSRPEQVGGLPGSHRVSNPQLELILQNLTQADLDDFTRIVRSHDWITRKELVRLTGKSEREIRLLAEAAGADIVRGPKGFQAFDKASLDEIQQAANISASQGKKMLRYSIRLKNRAHGRLGAERRAA